jgi:D-amino-acid dehydrogenase
VLGLLKAGGRIDGVHVEGEMLRADAYVVSLGAYSPLLTRPVGIDLDIYPAKGYSATMPVKDAARAFSVSLTDDEYKLVFSRLGDRLRIAGTAELNGYNTALNEARCRALLRRTEELFPGAGDAARAEFWTGLRPATPSNVPYIGGTRYPNLFLNTGHGTLGWTHSCGSARALADIVSGREPEIEFAFSTPPAKRSARLQRAPRVSPT